MKKLLLPVLSVLLFVSSKAQVRYLDDVYSNIQVDSNIVYGKNYEFYSNFNTLQDLKMDIYQPVSDTGTARPVIILAHAGSFLPPSVNSFYWSTKKQECIVELCKRYAKKGYVAIAMTYRLGWQPQATDEEVRKSTIMNAVYLAMQDMKGCVRFLKENAAAYKIDSNAIVLGGTNSGAYAALAAGNLNKTSELINPKFLDINNKSYIQQDSSGNFDGLGGKYNFDNYPNHSSSFKGVLSLGGAVADTSFIEAGEPPVIAFQGTNETFTPYNTATVIVTSTLQAVIEVSGSGDFMPYVDKANDNAALKTGQFYPGPKNKNSSGQLTNTIEGLYPFYQQGFEPWSWYQAGQVPNINSLATQAKAMKYIDTIMGYSTPRLYKLLVNPTYKDNYNGIEDLNESDLISSELFPNPIAEKATVKVTDANIEQIEIADLTGRIVFTKTFGTPVAIFDVSTLADGTYVMSGKTSTGKELRKKFVVAR